MTGLRLSNIGRSYGETKVLTGIDLEIAAGEFVAVLGPSGCGKTTLLRLVAGFDRPDEGTITLGDRLVAGGKVMVPPERRGIGIVFQNYALWPHMSVAENVGYALKVARLPGAEREARVARALGTVNLTAFAARRPADLSGGQRQRVALARCLAAGSDLVLLDEPLANLDVHLRATMEDEFRRFHRESGATLVYVTHDQSEAMAMADRIAVMDRGRLLQCASPESFIASLPMPPWQASSVMGFCCLSRTCAPSEMGLRPPICLARASGCAAMAARSRGRWPWPRPIPPISSLPIRARSRSPPASLRVPIAAAAGPMSCAPRPPLASRAGGAAR
ncbi:ABC transporter ATP-binding protein [Paracoccus cavernae]|uniref:ABC transporter ATP-binding protein n=1 Tax=Paracoccus cavernae TaxID=1571207 RepID=UPI00362728A9